MDFEKNPIIIDYEKVLMPLLEHCSKQKFVDLYFDVSTWLACPCPGCTTRKIEQDVIPALCVLAGHPTVTEHSCICYLLHEGKEIPSDIKFKFHRAEVYTPDELLDAAKKGGLKKVLYKNLMNVNLSKDFK